MTIMVVAGRRIDATNASKARFPLVCVDMVSERLRAVLANSRPKAMITSGACGADLVALQVAIERQIPCRMVLPFNRQRFRAESVVDRPGDWGPIFDRIYQVVKRGLGVKTLPTTHDAHRDFQRTNQYLIREAQRIAEEQGDPNIMALIMWDGAPRGDDDMTADFAALATKQHIPVQTIVTSA
jgi:hypothetical protein